MQCLCFVIFVVFTSCYLTSSAVVKAPSFIKPCNSTSPQCLKHAIQTALPGFIQGVPELGIISLDPFIIKDLRLMLPGGLKMDFQKGTTKGLRNCVVDSATMVNDLLDLHFHCNITIRGKYKSSGRLLMFAIDGDGDSLIKCRDLKVHYLIQLGTKVEADGENHLEIRNIVAKHSYEGRVAYRMTNLLKGNPAISNMIVEFMNRNWKLVAEEFGDPIVDFGMQNVVSNIKKLFEMVPMDQLLGFPVV